MPNRDPIVMTVAQEVVREGLAEVGRPDLYDPNDIYYTTQSQFGYAAEELYAGSVYFSAEHMGAVGKISKIGIVFLMVGFGASFGYAVMGRVSLLIGRFQFLFEELPKTLGGSSVSFPHLPGDRRRTGRASSDPLYSPRKCPPRMPGSASPSRKESWRGLPPGPPSRRSSSTFEAGQEALA